MVGCEGGSKGKQDHTMVIDCWSMAFSEIQVHVGPNIVLVFAIQRAISFCGWSHGDDCFRASQGNTCLKLT